MITPSLSEFLKLTRSANVIPVYTEINADLDTPVSAFLKIKKDDYAFLLESVEGREKVARYSFLGSRPNLVFKSKGREIEIIFPHQNRKKRFTASNGPLEEIQKIMQGFKPAKVKGLPRFYGGLVGYMGYDAVRFFEELPEKNPDDLKLPDALFILTDTIIIFDHVNHTIKIVANVLIKDGAGESKKRRLYQEAVRKTEEIRRSLSRPFCEPADSQTVRKEAAVSSNFKKPDFERIVRKAKEYIRSGDIIQVVLSQRFKIPLKRKPLEIYRALRKLNPSPYMYFLQLKDIMLVGSSPEMLVRCEEGVISTRPIAGTRPRGKTESEDRKLSKELLKDKKELAEHLMLVDLGRNDLGRVSLPRSVRVSEFMSVERYSHVMHIVSEVKGMLDKKRYTIYDVLRAAFPAGTVTGSPKIRAMEIIEELENIRRGPYAGCVGYISFSHNLDTCITIRTIVIKGKCAYIQAGAGIVADSLPEKEYFESVNKAKALVESIRKNQ